jgi:hypothetical protein
MATTKEINFTAERIVRNAPGIQRIVIQFGSAANGVSNHVTIETAGDATTHKAGRTKAELAMWLAGFEAATLTK